MTKDKTIEHLANSLGEEHGHDNVKVNVVPKPKKKEKLSHAEQMRLEKAKEEKMYAERGGNSIRDYDFEMKQITQTAKDEFNLDFHSYLPLWRRRQILDEMRTKREEKERAQKEANVNPAEPLPPGHSFPTEEEIGRMVDERLQKKLDEAKENAAFNAKVDGMFQERDREIERLRKRLNEKSPEEKAVERMMQRRLRTTHGKFRVQELFKFPLTQKVAEKLFELDQKVSNLLLDVGGAEYVITKNNIVSTAARRIMKVRGIDEPEMVKTEDGQVMSRWAEILKQVEKGKPKKRNSGF